MSSASSPEVSTAKEQQEQEDQANSIIVLSYTKDQLDELKKHTRKHIIKAYSIYFVRRNDDDEEPPRPEAGLNYSSYWCLKKYQLELVSLKKPPASMEAGDDDDGDVGDGGGYLALPTALDQTVGRLPAEYGDKPTEKLIEQQTAGYGGGAGGPAGAAIIVDEDETLGKFNYDSDVYASKLKKQAEEEGYQKLTYYTGIATWGTVFPILFNFGIHNDKDLMERFSSSSSQEEEGEEDPSPPSTTLLYQDIAVNRFFTKIYPPESDPETGAITQRVYYHFVAKNGGLVDLPEGLIPDEMLQKGTRMLRDLRAKVKDKQKIIAQETALLKTERFLAEKKYFDEEEKFAAQLDKQMEQLKREKELNEKLRSNPELLHTAAVIELQKKKLEDSQKKQENELLREGAPANAETVVEEEEPKHHWPIFGGSSNSRRANGSSSSSIDGDSSTRRNSTSTRRNRDHLMK
jgi:hypothetical protein